MVQNGRQLLILGLLRRGPMSAYEISCAVRGHSHLYRELKSGNLYEVLERQRAEGLLESTRALAKRGPSGKKLIYSPTMRGEERFLELLHEALNDVQAADWILEISYVLLGQLKREKALELLIARLGAIAEQERRLKRLRGSVEERVGAAYISASHPSYKLAAEATFLRDSIALLKKSGWSPTWGEEAVTPLLQE